MNNRTRISRSTILVTVLVTVAFAGASSARAQVVRQLTDVKNSDGMRAPVLDDAGTNVYFAASANPFASNSQFAFQIFQYASATGVGAQISSFADGLWDSVVDVSVSDDGQWLAFISRGNLSGQNNDLSAELFAMKTDGTQLAQLTSDPGPAAGAVKVVAMAGNGTRIAFVSNSNLGGGNPGKHEQVFLINRDGTGLAQATSFLDGEIPYLSVSDDGLRLAFSADGNPLGTNADGNYEVFSVNSTGTGLTQITSSTSGESSWTVISGNGSDIAFESSANLTGGNADLGNEVFDVDWGSSTIRQISVSAAGFESRFPAITDDGLVVYFNSNKANSTWRMFKVNSDGTGGTQVSVTAYQAEDLAVSGSGTRLAWKNVASGIPQIRVMNTDGTNPRTLLTGSHFLVDSSPAVTPDGTWAVFGSTANITGGNPSFKHTLYRARSDGTSLTQVTTNVDAYEPTISPDGNVILYSGIPVGGLQEIFRINADGTGTQQLTPNPPAGDSTWSQQPVISADGTTVVFTSLDNLTGGNGDKSGEIFRMNLDGTGKVQLTSSSSSTFYNYYERVDGTGTWITFSGNADPAGANADHSYEVWRVKRDGTGLQQLTFNTDPLKFAAYSDISSDGMKIVYSSNLDPLGTNADGNTEVFLYDVTSSSTRQLTFTTEGNHYYIRISGNGQWVYFHGDASDVEPDLHGGDGLYRINVASGEIRRADGLSLGPAYYEEDFPSGGFNYFPAVSDGGSAAFSIPGNFTRGNPDMRPELWIVDFAASPQIRISSGLAPTTVSWDIESGSVLYDVIRGETASLRTFGGVIDLGAVTCIENNSGDADTVGSADPDTPAAGRAFFYVYRGTGGAPLGPGSYGLGTSGLERIPASGDCQP